MALEIKSPPVLYGKEVREFLEKVAQAKCSNSREEVQESMRTTREFLIEQERLHPSLIWSI